MRAKTPGPLFEKIFDRLRLESVHGNPSNRSMIMIGEVESPAQIAELICMLIWGTGSDPTFSPIMKPEIYDDALSNAMRLLKRPTD